MEQLLRKLNNEHSDDVEQDKILSFIEDILRYLEDNKDKEYEINQGILGVRNLFCRYAVKVWIGTNFAQNKYHKLNKIAVRLSIQHYY